jgi:hypothetical protein
MLGAKNHRYGTVPWNKGKKFPGIGGRKSGCIPWNVGIPHSDETKRKISEARKRT